MKLNRSQLGQIFKEHDTLRAFEMALEAVDDTLPTTIEEANALAGSALAVAHVATSLLYMLSEAIERLEGAPSAPLPLDPDDTAPRAHIGTLAAQNADAIEITGGTIDGTQIGETTPAAAKFTTVDASEQITSTLPNGTAPLVVASITKVANLNADLLDDRDWAAPAAIGTTTPATGTFTDLTATGKFGCNGKSAQAAATSGGTLAGVIAALVANGILSS